MGSFLWGVTLFNGAVPYFVHVDLEQYDTRAYYGLILLYFMMQAGSVVWCLRARKKGADYFKKLEEDEYNSKNSAVSQQSTPRKDSSLELNDMVEAVQRSPRSRQGVLTARGAMSTYGNRSATDNRIPLLDESDLY